MKGGSSMDRLTGKRVRRAWIIFLRAVCGMRSPSLRRRVRIRDIWKTPWYM